MPSAAEKGPAGPIGPLGLPFGGGDAIKDVVSGFISIIFIPGPLLPPLPLSLIMFIEGLPPPSVNPPGGPPGGPPITPPPPPPPPLPIGCMAAIVVVVPLLSVFFLVYFRFSLTGGFGPPVGSAMSPFFFFRFFASESSLRRSGGGC